MSQCPSCRFENPLGEAVCQACGSKLSSWGSMLSGIDDPLQARPLVTIKVVRADGGPETVFSLKKDEVTIGTGAELLLPDDPFVARIQARVYFDGSTVTVEDQAGCNGVFARLRSKRELKTGQEIRCGRQRLLFENLPSLPKTSPKIWGSPDTGIRGRLIQLLEGGQRGEAFMLRDGDNLIGRDLGDITFKEDGFVSGRHAVIHARPDLATIIDLGSSNGTFLRVDSKQKLEDGDQLLIGSHLLKIALVSA